MTKADQFAIDIISELNLQLARLGAAVTSAELDEEAAMLELDALLDDARARLAAQRWLVRLEALALELDEQIGDPLATLWTDPEICAAWIPASAFELQHRARVRAAHRSLERFALTVDAASVHQFAASQHTELVNRIEQLAASIEVAMVSAATDRYDLARESFDRVDQSLTDAHAALAGWTTALDTVALELARAARTRFAAPAATDQDK